MRHDPRAVLRFAIEQRDWELAELIAERLAPQRAPVVTLPERTTTTLIRALGLDDPDYDSP